MSAILVTRARLLEASLYMPKVRDYIELLLLVNDIVSGCGTGKEILFFRKLCVCDERENVMCVRENNFLIFF
jgi:hypothetical protein